MFEDMICVLKKDGVFEPQSLTLVGAGMGVSTETFLVELAKDALAEGKKLLYCDFLCSTQKTLSLLGGGESIDFNSLDPEEIFYELCNTKYRGYTVILDPFCAMDSGYGRIPLEEERNRIAVALKTAAKENHLTLILGERIRPMGVPSLSDFDLSLWESIKPFDMVLALYRDAIGADFSEEDLKTRRIYRCLFWR